ncbi:Sterol uptake control protein 2 like [Verticillium longisporum]|uniref:Sterol uptake control protein 2 like n=3 Tax=Verticillium longisporum TaxID=100787 RepID=A0A8I3A0T4_VERLO|nr:Sterol uptake control protein 2 like [Verticillium longisporum]
MQTKDEAEPKPIVIVRCYHPRQRNEPNCVHPSPLRFSRTKPLSTKPPNYIIDLDIQQDDTTGPKDCRWTNDPRDQATFNGKSRSGCTQCKKRRVKCDCIGPVCANCRRRQEQCSYLGLLATNMSDLTTGLPIPTRNDDAMAVVRHAAAAVEHASSRDALINTMPAERWRADEAELKHHFFTHAWHTFSLLSDPTKCDVWSRWIPQLATRHIFIQQIMLSLSALHICYLQPPDPKRYYALTYQYSIQASNCFRLAIREMNEENWVLLVMFSMCNGIFDYYRPFLDENVMSIPYQPNPADTLSLMRVGGQFGVSIAEYMKNSPLRDKIQQADADAWAQDPDDLAPATLDKIAKLETWLRPGPSDSDREVLEAAAATKALAALSSWVKTLPGGKPRMFCHMVAWPVMLQEEYIALLRAKSPAALMVFILWSEVATYAPRRWYYAAWFQRGLSIGRRELEAQQPLTQLHRLWNSGMAVDGDESLGTTSEHGSASTVASTAYPPTPVFAGDGDGETEPNWGPLKEQMGDKQALPPGFGEFIDAELEVMG